MTRDEIRIIADIVGGDKTYRHFVHRINKEFDLSDEDRNSNVHTLFVESNGERIGFVVVGISPRKMKVWENTFKEEGWVEKDFKMQKDPFELMYMYIMPEYRKKGFGEKLFKSLIDFTKSKDTKEIYAYVGDLNDTAFNFYKRMNADVIQDLTDEDSTAAFLRWTI